MRIGLADRIGGYSGKERRGCGERHRNDAAQGRRQEELDPNSELAVSKSTKGRWTALVRDRPEPFSGISTLIGSG